MKWHLKKQCPISMKVHVRLCNIVYFCETSNNKYILYKCKLEGYLDDKIICRLWNIFVDRFYLYFTFICINNIKTFLFWIFKSVMLLIKRCSASILTYDFMSKHSIIIKHYYWIQICISKTIILNNKKILLHLCIT
jgi:hypothetical protein